LSLSCDFRKVNLWIIFKMWQWTSYKEWTFWLQSWKKLQQPENLILPGIAGVVCMLSLAVSTSSLIVTCTISATPVHEDQLTRIPETIGSWRKKSIMVTEGSICLKYTQICPSLTKWRQRDVKLRSIIMTEKAFLQVSCLGIPLILKCPKLGGYVACHWACYVPIWRFITWKVMSAKRLGYHPICYRKYEWGKEHIVRKNWSNTFVLTAFNFFGWFNIFSLVGDGSLWPRC
jgi:hypothetical protein